MAVCADAIIQKYFDGELTAAERQKVLAHLEQCESCRQKLLALTSLSERLRRARPLAVAPDQLRLRIAQLAEQYKQNEAQRPSGIVFPWKRKWLRPRYGFVAALAAVLFVVAGISLWTMQLRPQITSKRFVETAIEAHDDLLKAKTPLEIRSDSPKVVSAWFSERVPFDFRMPNAGVASEDLAKYALTGGRLVTFAGEPSALLVFRLRDQLISVLVASAKSTRALGGEISQRDGITFHAVRRGGLRVITWENKGLVYALIFPDKVTSSSCSACHRSGASAVSIPLRKEYWTVVGQ
jgi:anti-sigma factor RsiW